MNRRRVLSPSGEADLAAKMHLDTKRVKHCGFHSQRFGSGLCIGSISDVHMVRPMARHQCIARDAIEHRAHDRPLDRRLFPSAHRLRFRQPHNGTKSNIDMQCVGFDEDAAPDNFPGLPTPFSVPPPRGKYIGGWRSLDAPR